MPKGEVVAVSVSSKVDDVLKEKCLLDRNLLQDLYGTGAVIIKWSLPYPQSDLVSCHLEGMLGQR